MSVLTNPMLGVAQLEKLSFESLADIARQRGATIHPDSSAISKDEIIEFIVDKEQDAEIEQIYNQTLGG